jgi:hypothetical protein
MAPGHRAGIAIFGAIAAVLAIVVLRREPAPPMKRDPVTRPSTSVSASASASISAAPAPSPSEPPYDPKAEYAKNLAAAKDFKGTGCYGLATWVVPGRLAAMIRYECELVTSSEHDWPHREGVRWVGAAPGQVIDHRATYAEVFWAPKVGLWDLRGAGATYSVVASTGAPSYWAHKEWGYSVFKLDGDSWVEQKLIPQYPEAGEDVDHDGVPDFPFELVTLRDYDACSELADPRYLRRASVERLTVEGLEHWNGTAYVADVASFRPWYEARLREARADAAAIVSPTDAVSADAALPAHCQTDQVLQIALKLHVYAQVLGSSPAAAKSEVDKFLVDAGDAKVSETWSKAVIDGTPPLLPR